MAAHGSMAGEVLTTISDGWESAPEATFDSTLRKSSQLSLLVQNRGMRGELRKRLCCNAEFKKMPGPVRILLFSSGTISFAKP
jgi:hypothetical protein